MPKLDELLKNDQLSKSVDVVAGQVFQCLVGGAFAAFGLFAVWGGGTKLFAGERGQGIQIGLFGLVFAALGGVIIYRAITMRRRKKAAEDKWQAQTDAGTKPWLVRPDWAAGKIKSATGQQWKVMLLMGLAFSVMGGAMSFHFLKSTPLGANPLTVIVLIFPLIGLGLLTAVGYGFLRQRRFGVCYFELAQVPAPLGGTLSGVIQTGGQLKFEHALQLTLSCVRITVSGSGEHQSRTEKILWQAEKLLAATTPWPEPEPGRSAVPVHFAIPSNLPESIALSNTGEFVVWRLAARTALRGIDFNNTFEVPVFRLAGGAIASGKEPDPTAAWQVPVEKWRQSTKSRIRVGNVPGGTEFYFPAARNMGTVLLVTGMTLIWSFFLALMIVLRAPWFFPLIFGFIEVALLWSCLMLWTKFSRVLVNHSGVRLQTWWVFIPITRRFVGSDIVRFDNQIGMTSGQKAFYNVQLFVRSRRSGVTLGDGVTDKMEVDWLVQQMTRALGRSI